MTKSMEADIGVCRNETLQYKQASDDLQYAIMMGKRIPNGVRGSFKNIVNDDGTTEQIFVKEN